MNCPSPVLCHIDQHIARITLNRPDAGNAITLELAQALAAAIDQVSRSDARVLLLDAQGQRFCSGGDVDGLIAHRERLAENICAILTVLNPAMLRLANLPLPVISVVQGSVAGAGIALAGCADLVLASDRVRVRGAYSAIGLSPDIGASFHLVRRIGASRAKRLLMLNSVHSAEQCLALGLFDELHAPEYLAQAANDLAVLLADGATQAIGQIKQLCDAALDVDLETHLKLESAAILACSTSRDAAEGILACLEKREPRFLGR